jgi:tripartite-type tricarboxylate transporter receptor subunit TctC
MKRSTLSCVALAALTFFTPEPAAAQRTQGAAADFPNRPVRIIIPQAAGGGVDVVARTYAQKLSESWGQQVVIDNRPGANGIIGIEAVAKSKPDGYTLGGVFTSVLTINPHVYKTLPYDTFRDFTPITQTVVNTMVLVVNPYLPARSVKELVALGKSRPGELVYGSFGVGNQTHLAGELFRLESGLKLTHVPYKGETPAVTELLGGQIALLFATSAGVAPHIRAGRLRLLATGGDKRASMYPETPTMIEAGFPNVRITGWAGLVAPAGTPPEIVDRIYRETARHLLTAEMRERLTAAGAEPAATSPEQFAAFIKSESDKWSRVVQQAGIEHSQ